MGSACSSGDFAGVKIVGLANFMTFGTASIAVVDMFATDVAEIALHSASRNGAMTIINWGFVIGHGHAPLREIVSSGTVKGWGKPGTETRLVSRISARFSSSKEMILTCGGSNILPFVPFGIVGQC
ncbi:MAG: hypothetical protein Q8O32_02710 [bacterium]|nr:hypothetical protein [bacterium]